MTNEYPDPDTDEGYEAIVKAGCNPIIDSHYVDADCEHEYPWDCSSCPIIFEKYRILKPNERK